MNTPDPLWIYKSLYARFGPQHWWPADEALEIVAGAVLVQHTTWQNAARAVRRLADRVGFEPAKLLSMDEGELAEIIRPSGTYRVKARRLRAVARFFRDTGSMDDLASWPTASLRRSLLKVHGIGPETADVILLYAFRRPVFVVDAYARRLFKRAGAGEAAGPCESFAAWIESRIPADTATMNEFHALIVQQCKVVCQRRPDCNVCSIAARCAFAQDRRRELPDTFTERRIS